MLMRSEPFTEINKLAQQMFDGAFNGTWSRPAAMPVDAYRNGEEYVVAFDLPGVDANAIDIDVERNVLTVRAERRPVELGEHVTAEVSERPFGVFARRLFLADTLDTERIEATYDNGVLLLRIPISERAKARKVEVTGRSHEEQKVINS